MKPSAKNLRKNSTDAERWLWQHLRNRELGRWKFRRQHPIGPFIVDFVCIEKKLIIEVDGGQHAEDRTKDTKRSQFLERKGFRILRFWNNEILREGEAVLNVVLSSLVKKPPHPNPLPSYGLVHIVLPGGDREGPFTFPRGPGRFSKGDG